MNTRKALYKVLDSAKAAREALFPAIREKDIVSNLIALGIHQTRERLESLIEETKKQIEREESPSDIPSTLCTHTLFNEWCPGCEIVRDSMASQAIVPEVEVVSPKPVSLLVKSYARLGKVKNAF